MGLGFRLFARPIVSLMDSEKAHKRAITSLKLTSKFFLGRFVLKTLYRPKKLPCDSLGFKFDNPLGLAAGMDKNADALIGWQSLGFGFIEVGGVTEHEQSGNVKPRMFRSNKNKALINRMGFNNVGSLKMASALEKTPKLDIPVFLNVGKSKITEIQNAHLDYGKTVKRCSKYVDGFIIKVSSPNTPNLRDLQNRDDIERIITEVKQYSENKPILVKISPDLANEQILAIVDISKNLGCSGIVATNTTTSRPNSEPPMNETGGLSGEPLRVRSTEVIRLIADHTDGSWPIIGVGGITSADDAWEKITNGACLLQIYSTLVFNGAGSIKQIINGLEKKVRNEGLSGISEAVGLARR